jgi:uncharacterized repeat protein (TIGR04044 family)
MPKNIKDGDSLYSKNKMFPDYKAEPGQKALVQIHGMFTEASVTLIALLTAIRLQNKGFETSILLYGPSGALMASGTKGYPKVGQEFYPGHLEHSRRLKQFMEKGGKVYVCQFGLAAAGFREEDLIDGVIAFDPLDVLDLALEHYREGAFIMGTWM